MSIKGFIINGQTVKYNYPDLDNLPTTPSGGGITEALKTALLQLASKVAYIDDDGADYYQDLYDALYGSVTTYTISNFLTAVVNSNAATTIVEDSSYTATLSCAADYEITSVSVTMGGVDVTGTSYTGGIITIANVTGNIVITAVATQRQATLLSISAVFTQGQATIYDSDSLDSLKQYLTVTASWDDSTTSTVAASDYTLSGTLTVGTSTITASYGGKSDTFNVTVSSDTWTVVQTIGSDYSSGCLNLSTGEPDSNTDWYTSGFITVPDGATSYSRQTSRTSDYYFSWYDSEQAFIGNAENGTYAGNGQYGGGYTDGNSVLWNVVPSTAKYCRVSWRTSATYTSVTFMRNSKLNQSKTPAYDTLYFYDFGDTSTTTQFYNQDYLRCAGMAYAQVRPIYRRAVSFYDDDFIKVSEISRANNIGDNVEIPNTAKYMKVEVMNRVTQSASNTTLIGQGLIKFTATSVSTW